MDVAEIFKEINNLKEMINLIDSNLKFNINIFLVITTLVVMLIGGALYIWAKFLVSTGIKHESEKINNTINKQNTVIESQKNQLADLKEYVEYTLAEERGIWTPFLREGNHTYTKQIGNYYRIGKLVVLWLEIEIENIDLKTEGSVYIGGLPFAFMADDGVTGNITLINKIDNKDICVQLMGKIKKSVNIALIHSANDKTHERLKYSSLSSKAKLYGTIIHWID